MKINVGWVLGLVCLGIVGADPAWANCKSMADQWRKHAQLNTEARAVQFTSAAASQAKTPPPQSVEQLLDCLGHHDPRIRDDFAFTELSKLLRANQVDDGAKNRMTERLLVRLERFLDWRAAKAGQAQHFDEFETSFSLLALAELARADRLQAYWSESLRARVVSRAQGAIAAWRDYRGFDAKHGWRHGLAHGADLALQLGMNLALGHDDLVGLTEALLSQVIPERVHFHRYGEGERMARAILMIAGRDQITTPEWQTLFDRHLLEAQKKIDWQQAFKTQHGLAARHNAYGFLFALNTLMELNTQVSSDKLKSVVIKAIQQLP